jgi:hypothetical protein
MTKEMTTHKPGEKMVSSSRRFSFSGIPSSPGYSPVLWIFLATILAGGFSILIRARIPDRDSWQTAQSIRLPLDEENSIGQSFTVPSGQPVSVTLNGAYSSQPGWHDETLIIHLRQLPADPVDIATLEVSTFVWRFSPQMNIHFPVRPKSPESAYYLLIQTRTAPGHLVLFASPGDFYNGGSAYQNGVPIASDLAFSIHTSPFGIHLQESLIRVLPRVGVLVLLTLLFTALGFMVIGTIPYQFELDWIEKSILSLAAGLCIPNLVMIGLSVFKIPASSGSILTGLSALAITGLGLKWLFIHVQTRSGPSSSRPGRKIWIEYGIVILLFLMAVTVRTLQTADELVPRWFDGYFHQYILDEIITAQKLPLDLNYPAGYHTLAYFTHLFFQVNSPMALLLTGQWLSAISGLTFFMATKRWIKNPTARITVLIFYWFLCPFPTYLTSWSRFPLLLGLTILPAVIFLFNLNSKDRIPRIFASVWLMTGIAFANYSIFFFCLCFILTMLLSKWKEIGFPINNRVWAGIGVLTILCGLIAGSRMVILFQSGEWTSLIEQTRINAQQANLLYLFWLTLQNGGSLTWLLGIVGIGLAIFHNRPILLSIAGWLGLILAGSGIQAVILGASVSSITNLILFLSIPLCLLIGCGLDPILPDSKSTKHNRFSLSLFTAGLVWLAMTGAINQLGSLNPATRLFTDADQRAAAWINANIPTGETILINTTIWNGKAQPGDGGGWLSTFTGNPVVLAPYGNDTQALETQTKRESIQYIYQGRGQAHFPEDYLRQQEIVYQKDGVSIYRVR